MPAHKIRHLKKRAFLAAYAETGNVRLGADAAGVDRSMHYHWLQEDPDYAAAFADAEEQAGDLLEAEARRRAVEGVAKPVYQQGQMVGTVQEYSDTLLIFLLKGVRPQKFRERVDLKQSGKVEHQHSHEHDFDLAAYTALFNSIIGDEGESGERLPEGDDQR